MIYTLRKFGENRYRLFAVVLISAMLITALIGAEVVNAATAKDAIAVAAAYPPIAQLLAQVPGWKAIAFDSGNRYGVWRVEFSRDDTMIGWAAVNPAKRYVYSYEFSNMPSTFTDEQYGVATAALDKFIRTDPELIKLIGRWEGQSFTSDYEPQDNTWSVKIAINNEALKLVFQFKDKDRAKFTQPVLRAIYFRDLPDYATWTKTRSAEAIALAYRDARIADILRGSPNWTGSATFKGGSTWTVSYGDGARVIATAEVDLKEQVVTAVTVR